MTGVRAALLTVAVGAGTLAVVTAGPDEAPRSAAAGQVPPQPAVVLGAGPTAGASPPVSVELPSIGVRSDLVGLSVDAAGALETPTDFAQAGWFEQGTLPGEVGPAVIAGHVDSVDGPAVFYRLEELAPGDELSVTRADGVVVRFQVTRVGVYPKAEFPTEEVYGPTASAELRLITCGGVFDRSRRSYVDNVVVYAREV